jgi:hypothetical protein
LLKFLLCAKVSAVRVVYEIGSPEDREIRFMVAVLIKPLLENEFISFWVIDFNVRSEFFWNRYHFIAFLHEEQNNGSVSLNLGKGLLSVVVAIIIRYPVP